MKKINRRMYRFNRIKNYPALRSSTADYVPDSPTSVVSSGPPPPPWAPHDEDFTFPYWGWRWLAREEAAARYWILLREHTEGHSLGEEFLKELRLAYRLFLDEQTAGRYLIQSMADKALVYLEARRRQLHP